MKAVVLLSGGLVALAVLREALGMRFGAHRLFYMTALLGEPATIRPSAWAVALILLDTVLAVVTPIKIWNTARIEHRLHEQEKLLLAAKIEALKSQINPHFLFNALNNLRALINEDPARAREMVSRLMKDLEKGGYIAQQRGRIRLMRQLPHRW